MYFDIVVVVKVICSVYSGYGKSLKLIGLFSLVFVFKRFIMIVIVVLLLLGLFEF